MKEGLLRQRRNLMTACVLLWVMKYGGVTFSKISFAGFDVDFNNPNALIATIWIAYSYFLYRYYQYFSEEGVTKLREVFCSALEIKCEPIIKNIVKKMYPTNNDAIRYSYAFLKRDGWVYKGHALGEYEPSTGKSNNEHFEIQINQWMLKRGIFTALISSILRNSVVTDYLLPFALAGWVLYYCGRNNWNGSFLRLWFGPA